MPRGLPSCNSGGNVASGNFRRSRAARAFDRPGANGSGAPVRSGGIRPAVRHRVRHFYAGRETVEDQPARLRDQTVHQRLVRGEFRRQGMKGSRRLSFDLPRGCEHFRARGAFDNQGCGAKDFVDQIVIFQKCFRAGRKQCRAGGGCGGRGDDLDLSQDFDPGGVQIW